jgi:hypothetical protein
MKIICEQCHSEIDAEDIDLKEKLAKCNQCNHIFNIHSQIKQLHKDRGEIDLPKNITIQESPHGLQITRSWSNILTAVSLTIFCVFWDGFMIVWFSIALLSKNYMMAAFGSIHGVVGLLMTYYCIALFINQTHILINVKYLTISHKPLPFPGAKSLYIRDFKQFYTKERAIRSRSSSRSHSYYRYIYDLMGISHQDKHIKILSGLSDKIQALYIEQQIEKYLKMEDVYIEGETE